MLWPRAGRRVYNLSELEMVLLHVNLALRKELQPADTRWSSNLPIGFVSLLLILVCFNRQNTVTEDRNLPTKVKVQRLDLLGATLLISGLCCLLLALQWAGTSQPWRSSKIIGLFIGFGLILGCFFFLQWRLGSNSTMPLQVLFQRSIAFGSAFELLVNMSNYAVSLSL